MAELLAGTDGLRNLTSVLFSLVKCEEFLVKTDVTEKLHGKYTIVKVGVGGSRCRVVQRRR